MRLHHLSLTAFGAFAGTERIDFDALCDAGLFLMTGPTGAGKTTILDAVSFALYGSVPGVRGVKTLKSQHAADDVAPEVVLDFSVRDRRFVVRRRPEWTRPKRRGPGLITEKASATLLETTRGDEHLLSSRAQEVGHFVGDLIGMQSTQFVQVAMLPQGEFQRFLRAGTQERHEVLQHLFRTDRFARIEDWVHDRCRGLGERSADRETEVRRILDTIADRVGVDLPDDLGDRLCVAAAEGRVTPWATDLLLSAETEHTDRREAHGQAAARSTQLRSRLGDVTRRCEARGRRDQARAELAALAGGRASEESARDRLDGDTRAARVAPFLQLLDEAGAAREAAATRWTEQRGRLAEALDGQADAAEPVTAALLEGLEQAARARVPRLEAVLPRQRLLDQARRDLESAVRELVDAEARRRETAARCDAIPQQVLELRAGVEVSRETASRAEALGLELESGRRRLVAAREVAAAETELALLRDVRRDARDAAATAREHMLDVNARRLAGIAAELAGRLVDGRPCEVCGSAEHPRPAEARHDAVTEEEQEAATAAFDARNHALDTATRRLTDAERALEALRERAGGHDVPAAHAVVETAAEALQVALDAQRALHSREQQLEALVNEQEDLSDSLRDLDTTVARLTQLDLSLGQTLRDAAAEIAAVTGATDAGSSVPALLRLEQSRLEVVGAARAALAGHDDAVAREEQVSGRAVAAAAEHGFVTPDEARTGVLDPADRAALERLLTSRRERSDRAQAVLADPALGDVREDDLPSPRSVADALAEAESVTEAASRVLHHQEGVVDALRASLTRLGHALARWAPIREDFARAESMSRLVRGMGADNQLQMRLSAYVLATRLDQVVAAANERLAHMRDQRYLLQRTGRAARKGVQAGLGLEVLDQWTGDVRDPATLSGGETFVVSLSLALGLADVVTQEAGGTEIETLFVDEGFGTLDADTLDDVMDRLDDLRTGGRAVGVISHVGELRNRIPTQLHVDKGRTGSTVSVRTLVG